MIPPEVAPVLQLLKSRVLPIDKLGFEGEAPPLQIRMEEVKHPNRYKLATAAWLFCL